MTDNSLEQYWRELKVMKKNNKNLAQESTDDAEDQAHLMNVAIKREKTLKRKSRRIGKTRANNKVTKREMLEQTKRLLIEEDIATNMDDSDDDRLDFMDANAEEATDNLLKSYRQKSRPLKLSEVHHLS